LLANAPSARTAFGGASPEDIQSQAMMEGAHVGVHNAGGVLAGHATILHNKAVEYRAGEDRTCPQ
jgi:hypothetical protein